MDLAQALLISTLGMDAQTERLRAIAETLATRDGTYPVPFRCATSWPARRMEHDPGGPVADRLAEIRLAQIRDMRDAERSHSANLGVIQASRSMLTRTIDLLK